MNDNERIQWVENDEPLYLIWQESGLSKREFVKQRRAGIDDFIKAKMEQQREI